MPSFFSDSGNVGSNVVVPPRRSHTHLAARVFNTPLAIYRPKGDAILRAIGPRLGVHPDMYHDVDEKWLEKREQEQKQKQSGPVALIQVYDTLVKRGDFMSSMSGLTSYESLKASVQSAMQDPQVKALLFDIDSPGGEAAGLFDFADWLSSLRGEKPMIGISNDSAYSAAYAIASCMDKLFVTGVGGVGSIGVYMMHMDQSGWDKQNGVTFTYIQSGEKKTDGNPHEPLSKDAKAEMQAHVDKIRDMFVSLVAANRNVSTDKIYDTEAGTYMGEDGVPMLADAVCCFDEAAEYTVNASKQKRSVAMPTVSSMRVSFSKDNTPHFTESFSKRGSVHLVKSVDEGRRHLLRLSSLKDGDTAEVAFFDKWMAMRQNGTAKMDTKTNGGLYGRISGVLAPYNVLSCDLGGFREVYTPGCFKKSLEGGDPLILAFHDPSKVLGRKSAGTARFWEEADGLYYQVDLPNTQDAQDLRKLVERGDVRGASAAFFIEKYRWETRGQDRVRVIEQAELVEGSPHSFTAYNDTTAEAEQAAAAAHDELIGVRLRLLNTDQGVS